MENIEKVGIEETVGSKSEDENETATKPKKIRKSSFSYMAFGKNWENLNNEELKIYVDALNSIKAAYGMKFNRLSLEKKNEAVDRFIKMKDVVIAPTASAEKKDYIIAKLFCKYCGQEIHEENSIKVKFVKKPNV